MKKLISIVLSLIMLASVLSLNAYAASGEIEIVGISRIGDLEPLDSYYFNGDISVTQAMGKDGFDFLYNAFTDENLVSVDSNITELVNSSHPNYPQEAMEFGFSAVGEISYSASCEFRFNKDIILVSFFESSDDAIDDKLVRQGFFKFKDASVYDEIMVCYEKWEDEQKQINQESEDARQENKVNISDFEFIYKAEYSDTYSSIEVDWGICTYKREGESEPVIAMCHIIAGFDEWTYVVVSEKMPENNTFEIPARKVVDIRLGEMSSEEYETSDFTVSGFKYHVNVNEDMSVQSVLYSIDEYGVTQVFDASVCEEYGKIPEGFFSVQDNADVVDDSKTDIEADDTAAEDGKTETEKPQTDDKKAPADEKVEEKDEQTEITEKEDEKIVEKETEETEKTEKDEPEDEGKAEAGESERQQDDKNEPTEDEEKVDLDYDFIDVPETHWAHNEIHSFAEQEIVLGYGNGYFGVNDSITYEHFALLLQRLFDYKTDNTQRVPAIREDIIVSVVKALRLNVSNADVTVIDEKFSDCGKIKEENKKYIATAIEIGLVVGSYGKLYPEDKLTRAETVVLLSRALNY